MEVQETRKGFTLVELMIVIVIIGILAAIIIPTVSGAIDKAREAKDESAVSGMNRVLSIAAIEDGVGWYDDVSEIRAILAEGGYDLVPARNTTTFWYDRAENKIVTENGTISLMSNNYINTAEAAAYPIRLEQIHASKASYLYVDQKDDALSNSINNLRDLFTTAGGTVTYISLLNAFNANTSAFSDGNDTVSRLEAHINSFSPEHNLYISEYGFIFPPTTGDILRVNNIIFAPSIRSIPKPDGLAPNLTIQVLNGVVEIPHTVESVGMGAFLQLSRDTTVVVRADMTLSKLQLNPACTQQKSPNVNTTMVIPIYYYYGTYSEGNRTLAAQDTVLALYTTGTGGGLQFYGDVQYIFSRIQKEAVAGDETKYNYSLSDCTITTGIDKATGAKTFTVMLNSKDGTIAAYGRVRYFERTETV